MMILRSLMLLLVLITAVSRPASATVTDSLQHQYPFLKTDSNQFRGHLNTLFPFFSKLERIAAGAKEQAVIVHIGDSHVQPGAITAPLRNYLQQEFGNAGRGHFFPYRVAKSNGPDGYSSRSGSAWTITRIALKKRTLPAGLSGFTLQSDQPEPEFSITFNDPGMFGAGTNLLTLFHEKGDSAACFTLLSLPDSAILPMVDSLSVRASVFALREQPTQIRVAAAPGDSNKKATFYGMNLQGSEPGVVVHTIGVNGATFADYLHAEYFASQLATLRPDLIIFSLGTNETVNAKVFSSDSITKVIDSLITEIESQGIRSAYIFTTPPAIYKRYRKNRKYYYKPDPVAGEVSHALIRHATERNHIYWDWYTIMGGKNSMAKWKAKHLTDRKYLHFTMKGYSIQGKLLNSAFRKALDQYRNNR